jgi:hypothetical protein
MLQLFYQNVVYVLQWFSSVFASVSDTCFKCFICFFCTLQVLHPNVLKLLDRVFAMGYVWEDEGGASGPRGHASRVDVQRREPMHGRGKTNCSCGRPGANSTVFGKTNHAIKASPGEGSRWNGCSWSLDLLLL